MRKKSLHGRLLDLMMFSRSKNVPLLPRIIQRLLRMMFACDIPSTVKIGEGTKFAHGGLGVVIHANSVIGENCEIYQNVTIGGRHERGCPTIGNGVFIGAGACVLGGIKIGDGSMIGANAVVIKDVPPNTVIGGIPGKVIKSI